MLHTVGDILTCLLEAGHTVRPSCSMVLCVDVHVAYCAVPTLTNPLIHHHHHHHHILCPQLYTNFGKRPEPAQQRGAHHGSGCGGVQGRFRRGPRHQPERPVLPGPFLHEPHLHTHAHEPAQSV